MTKIKYIETKPINQIIEFEDRGKYQEFFEKRIKDILDYTYPNNLNFYDYFKYERVLLNKNGKPRKTVNPKWLHTKKAHDNQRKNWLIYCDKRKKQTLEQSNRRKRFEIESKIEYWQKQLEELENVAE